MNDGNNIIRFNKVTKSFPGVTALREVSFGIKKGEVHAIVGENGAGKSTLVKILSGIQKEDNGKIFIDDKEVDIRNPKDAINLGITCIYQELPLAQSLSISDNVFLGREIKTFGFLNKGKQRQIVKRLFKDFDIDINPNNLVEKLSVSMQQITAIIKSMMKEATVFIMDEPTAALGEHEVEHLFNFIRKIRKKGVSVIYISHRMDEIFDIADSVTVLKDGNYMGTKQVDKISKDELIKMMTGSDIHNSAVVYDSRRGGRDINVLEINNLNYGNKLKNINFSLKKGEILGVTGLVGAGKTELLKSIYGLYNIKQGKIIIDNEGRSNSSIFGLVPEDRKREGLFLDLSIIHNISISSLRFLNKLLFINKIKEIKLIKKYIKDIDIKTNDINKQVRFLSGGNQQKVIFSRWLGSKKSILLMDEPTRGIDIKAKTEIYRVINQLSRKGISTIFSSSDVSEVISISDRVLVMRDGRIVKIFGREDFDKKKILKKMLMD